MRYCDLSVDSTSEQSLQLCLVTLQNLQVGCFLQGEGDKRQSTKQKRRFSKAAPRAI